MPTPIDAEIERIDTEILSLQKQIQSLLTRREGAVAASRLANGRTLFQSFTPDIQGKIRAGQKEQLCRTRPQLASRRRGECRWTDVGLDAFWYATRSEADGVIAYWENTST